MQIVSNNQPNHLYTAPRHVFGKSYPLRVVLVYGAAFDRCPRSAVQVQQCHIHQEQGEVRQVHARPDISHDRQLLRYGRLGADEARNNSYLKV